MSFTPRDVKDVSALVAKKLELYMNQERREERFDTQGHYRTNPKMRTLDLMYQMLDATELSKKSHRRKHRSSSSSKRKDSKKTEDEVEAHDESDQERHKKTNKESSKEKKKKKKITPVVINNSLRVVPHNEAERLTDIANKVFDEQDLDKLHVIHRYRPNSRDIAPLTENGKVANYTLHVGSALHSTNYVNYYVKEGLHSSKKDCAKRLQRLNTKKGEDGTQSNHDNETSPDERKGQSSSQNHDEDRPVFNPLIDQSTESLLSNSMLSGNLSPMNKDKPMYNTISNTRPSSRGSSDKQSKASSQLNKARMFANGYGYRIVADKKDDYGVFESTQNRNESRADIASSEEYCKFSSVKHNASVDSGRIGDGLEAVAMSNMPTNENDLDYNKFQSTQSSLLLSGLEEDDSRAKSYYNNSCPTSQRSARSERSDSKMSQKSFQSVKSSTIYMEGSMSVCTEESDLYELEEGPDTARSISYPLSTPRRSSKKVYKPIQTLISSKDVPRLGLTSDINDSNGSWNGSWNAEDYVTAEEKAKMNTDTRALEDRKNASQERAGDEVLGNSCDDRADRSLQKVWNHGDEFPDTKVIQTNSFPPNCDHVENGIAKADKEAMVFATASEEAANEIITNHPPIGTEADTSDLQMNGASNSQKETTAEDDNEEMLSSRTSKTLIDFDSGVGRRSSRSTNSSGKKVTGKEKSDAERGEDKVESMELHRGQAPEVDKNKRLTIRLVERGDDTPRTMAAKGRLTKSAKKRGMSNYYTMGDEERGLEKEYFASVGKDVQEIYIKARISDDEEEPETPASSRPSSASSSSCGSSKDSEYDGRNKSLEDVLGHVKKNGSHSQAIDRSNDGRGDDSISLRSGSVLSAVSGGGSRKKKQKRSFGSDENDVSRTRRSDEQTVKSKSVDLSGGSRGSRNTHVKLGVGQGYCIEGEILARGYDEGILRQLGGTIGTQVDENFKKDDSRDEERPDSRTSRKSDVSRDGDRPSSKASHRSGASKTDNRPASRASQQFVQPQSGVKDSSEKSPPEVLNQSTGLVNEPIVLDDGLKQEMSAKNENEDAEEGNQILDSCVNINHEVGSTVEKDFVKNIPAEADQEPHSVSANEHNYDGNTNIATKDEKVFEGEKKTEIIVKDNLTAEKHNEDQPQHLPSEEKIMVEMIKEEKHGETETDGPEREETDFKTGQSINECSKEKGPVVASEGQTNFKMEQSVNDSSKENGAVSMPYEEGTASKEIAMEEKAFIECDMSDNDIVKEAVSVSASMFNENSDTVIDFRPSSASTAISVGREQYTEHKRLSIQKPAKIVEVTEIESNFGSARESYRSTRVADQDVLHPASKKKRGSKDQGNTGAILNIADVKLDQVLENGHIAHPAMRNKSHPEDDKISSSRSRSLPCTEPNEMNGEIILDDKKSQSADEIPYFCSDIDKRNSEPFESTKKADDKADEAGEEKKELLEKENAQESDKEPTEPAYTKSEKEIIMTSKEVETGIHKEITHELTGLDVHKKQKIDNANAEEKRVEDSTGKERQIEKIDEESKPNGQNTENQNQNEKLETVKMSEEPIIMEQHEANTKNTREEDTCMEHKEVIDNNVQIEVTKTPNTDVIDGVMKTITLEVSPMQDNVVADIISTNLKLNNESPRPNENLNPKDDKGEDQMPLESECINVAKELPQSEPYNQIHNGQNVVELQPVSCTFELPNKNSSTFNEVICPATDGSREFNEKSDTGVQQPPSNVNVETLGKEILIDNKENKEAFTNEKSRPSDIIQDENKETNTNEARLQRDNELENKQKNDAIPDSQTQERQHVSSPLVADVVNSKTYDEVLKQKEHNVGITMEQIQEVKDKVSDADIDNITQEKNRLETEHAPKAPEVDNGEETKVRSLEEQEANVESKKKESTPEMKESELNSEGTIANRIETPNIVIENKLENENPVVDADKEINAEMKLQEKETVLSIDVSENEKEKTTRVDASEVIKETSLSVSQDENEKQSIIQAEDQVVQTQKKTTPQTDNPITTPQLNHHEVKEDNQGIHSSKDLEVELYKEERQLTKLNVEAIRIEEKDNNFKIEKDIIQSKGTEDIHSSKDLEVELNKEGAQLTKPKVETIRMEDKDNQFKTEKEETQSKEAELKIIEEKTHPKGNCNGSKKEEIQLNNPEVETKKEETELKDIQDEVKQEEAQLKELNIEINNDIVVDAVEKTKEETAHPTVTEIEPEKIKAPDSMKALESQEENASPVEHLMTKDPKETNTQMESEIIGAPESLKELESQEEKSSPVEPVLVIEDPKEVNTPNEETNQKHESEITFPHMTSHVNFDAAFQKLENENKVGQTSKQLKSSTEENNLHQRQEDNDDITAYVHVTENQLDGAKSSSDKIPPTIIPDNMGEELSKQTE